MPVYLVLTGLVHRIVASDISAGSLESARRTAAKYCVQDKITFITAPGLDWVFNPDKNITADVDPVDTIDTVVIAGMGGETIAGILGDAPRIKDRDIKLILQPQTKVDVLCRFLYDNEYTINETKTVIDRAKTYTIIVARSR